MSATKTAVRSRIWLLAVVAALQLAFCCTGAWAQRLTLAQMDHTAWSARDGAPIGVNDIAEGGDGTLWIATRGGLFNFDGIHFTPYLPPPGELPLPTIEMRGVYAAADGSLWINPWLKGLVHLKDGHTRIYGERDGLPANGVVETLQAPDGAMWALTNGSLYRLAKERWTLAISKPEVPEYVLQFYFDRAGTLWIATTKDISFVTKGSSTLQKTSESGQAIAKFLEMPDGSLWADAFAPVSVIRRLSVPGHLSKNRISVPVDAAEMTTDTNGNLWIANNRGGIERIAADALTLDKKGKVKPGDPGVELYGQSAGLSGIGASAVMRDTNGTIWVGTTRGMDRFRSPTLTKLPDPTIEGDVGVTACPNGTVWMGSGDFLVSINHGIITHHSFGDLWGIYCDHNNSLWFNRIGKIVELHDGVERSIAAPPTGLASCILQVVGDADDLFASCTHNALWRRRKNHWEKVEAAGFPRESPLSLMQDSTGRLWSGYSDNKVGLLDGSAAKTIPVDTAPGVGPVQAIVVATNGVFAGGAHGLAVLNNDHFQSMFTEDPEAVQGISGLVQSHDGDLWLNGARGVYRIVASEVAKALSQREYRMASQRFSGDGLVGFTYQGYELPTAVLAPDGRIWIATSSIGVYIDPALIRPDTTPPTTSIQVFSDNEVTRSVAHPRISPGKHTLRIRYFGAHLLAPDRVVYRYRLDGQDSGWQDVGGRTEAVYTNLKPGEYTFHVAASNGEGVWSEAPSPLVFEVLPAFYQRWWFLALCILAIVLALAVSFRMRFRYITRRLRQRLEERAQERIRISRDLHDTLLQGIQGLILCFHADIEEVPESEPARAMLEKTLTRAEEVIAEGRDRVRTLRSEESMASDLPEALASVSSLIPSRDGTTVEFVIEGRPRPLRTIVHDEIYCIGREAITNALLHAKASRIEVQISYGEAHLIVRCKDNGRGMTRDQIDAGSPVGHWGLTGMRERVTRIGGKLDIWSTPGAGTEVEFSVPAATTYFVQLSEGRVDRYARRLLEPFRLK